MTDTTATTATAVITQGPSDVQEQGTLGRTDTLVGAATTTTVELTVEEHKSSEQDHVRTICIGVDYSDHSNHAVEWTLKNLARKEGDLVVLMHVRPETVPTTSFGLGYVDYGGVLFEMERVERENSHEFLRKLAAKVKDAGISVKAVAMRGDPREEISRKVKELNADALVVGSRGLGTMKRMVLGSVSSYLMHNLTVPVIIVKEKE